MSNTILVPLTQGFSATIDAEDADQVLQHKWHAIRVYKRVYAMTKINRKGVYLHRFLLPDAKEVDHKDRDGLNNRRANLRSCTHSQNAANSEIPPSRSGFRGVRMHPAGRRQKRYQATVKQGWRARSLGYYFTPEEAARAYDKAARELFGEFAYQNFPD